MILSHGCLSPEYNPIGWGKEHEVDTEIPPLDSVNQRICPTGQGDDVLTAKCSGEGKKGRKIKIVSFRFPLLALLCSETGMKQTMMVETGGGSRAGGKAAADKIYSKTIRFRKRIYLIFPSSSSATHRGGRLWG